MFYYSLYTSACSIEPIPSPYLFRRCATKDTLAFGLFSVNQQQIQEEVVLENNQLICNTLCFYFTSNEGRPYFRSSIRLRMKGQEQSYRSGLLLDSVRSPLIPFERIGALMFYTCRSVSLSLGEESRQGKNPGLLIDILVRQLDQQMLISLKDLISSNFLSFPLG